MSCCNQEDHIHAEKAPQIRPLDRATVVVELVVTILAVLASVLHAIERRLAGKRAARLVEHGGERRIVSQRVVVDLRCAIFRLSSHTEKANAHDLRFSAGRFGGATQNSRSPHERG